jgi:chorismate--pyruvate lyase
MNRRPHFREPVWRTVRQPASVCPPAALLPWLQDGSSLTQRLVERCGPAFRVELIKQARIRPTPGEAFALGLRPGAFALLREVYLCCGTERWVYARTLIPDATARGRYRRLRRLGERSLGGFLFAQPHLARGPLEIALARAGALAQPAWGRRSVFRLGGRPLVVTEYFLPAFTRTL